MPQHRARTAVPKAYTPEDLDTTIDGVGVTSTPSLPAEPERRIRTPSLLQVISIRGGGNLNLSPRGVTALGAVVNVMLSLLKFVVGTASGSASLVADAYHSGSDLLVDGVTMLAVHAPPSLERAATFVIAGLLSTAGGAMMWGASLALWRRSAPALLGTPPLLVALVAIACKEALFRITRGGARRTRQQVLLASAKHHRSDAMSSLAAAVGAVGVLVGLPLVDNLAAAVVGGMMFSMGVSVAIGEEH